jgi:SPP1 gp7 family putative phage head morphogenesis protein
MLPKKPTVIRAIWPNVGTRNRYHRRILKLVAEMAHSVEYWVTARRKSDPPTMAADASPVEEILEELRDLVERWQKKFDEMAPTVADSFLKNQFQGTDNAMRQALRDAGWSIEFTLTPAMREAFEASLAENVGLIRSIPAQYLQEVEGIVMRNYTSGRNVRAMAEEIRGRYKVASNRAWLIARDQSNKANAVVQRTRQTELGIKEGIWLHSNAGKTPRPTHVAMNGKRYEIAKGMYDSAVKKWILPGELVGCRCQGRSVLPWTPAEPVPSQH